MPQPSDAYRVNDETTVGEALFVVNGAEEIFRRHSCEAEFECTEEHHREYPLIDTSLSCHVDDTDALIADLNASVEAEAAAGASAS